MALIIQRKKNNTAIKYFYMGKLIRSSICRIHAYLLLYVFCLLRVKNTLQYLVESIWASNIVGVSHRKQYNCR